MGGTQRGIRGASDSRGRQAPDGLYHTASLTPSSLSWARTSTAMGGTQHSRSSLRSPFLDAISGFNTRHVLGYSVTTGKLRARIRIFLLNYMHNTTREVHCKTWLWMW